MTHGTSTRLTGGLGGSFQSPGMGEGWSDAVAIMLLAQSGDDPDANYCTGGYTTYQLGAGFVNNYYFGIRRFPYSTNLNIYPLTFADIQTLTYNSAIPANPLFIGNGASEVHNEGEIWCNMVLDCRAQMWHTYGFAGNRRMLQLVIDGLKLTGVNPTFQIARNAILQADMVDYGNADNGGPDYTELYQAFARHGLGFSSSSPNGYNSVTGIIEGYDTPQYVTFTYPDGPLPTHLLPGVATNFHVNMAPTALTITPGTATLHYSVNGGADNPTPLTVIGPTQFAATIPAQACFANVTFYISVGTSAGNRTDPGTACPSRSDTPGVRLYRHNHRVLLRQHEDRPGVDGHPRHPGGHDGPGIAWVRADPIGTAAQPEDDHTPGSGVNCWFTGQGTVGGGLGDQDVDGGQTILTSPTMNCSPDASASTLWSPTGRLVSPNNQGNQPGTWRHCSSMCPSTTARAGRGLKPSDRRRRTAAAGSRLPGPLHHLA